MFALEIINNDSLYSVKYEENDENELRIIFNQWSDTEYLEQFFEDNKTDLQREFYNYISIEEAILRTLDEAEKLEDELIRIAKAGQTNRYENLQTFFKPLYDNEYPLPKHQKSKAYGSLFKSWLRLYAIRVEPNVFIITGGAIKLTKTMNDRPHLIKELDKLEKVKRFFEEEELIDNESIIGYIEID